MSKLNYYFAGWDRDSSDIFSLMEDWWEDTPLKDTGKIDIDRDAFLGLHESDGIITICARDEKDKLVACFVGMLVPDIFRKGKNKIQQIAACFTKEYRSMGYYTDMLGNMESICSKLSVNFLEVSSTNRVCNILINKKGWIEDSSFVIKEIG